MDAGTYYFDYLQLDRLLSSQDLASERAGRPAHDEMLFIIVHQAYELWFKQILWELGAVSEVMGRRHVDERDMARVVAHLERITKIQRVLVQHLDVLETMTPMDFLEFRDLLVPASGFQSLQFRLIENALGLVPDERLKIGGVRYTDLLREPHASQVRATEDQPSLLAQVERWLARTPFLHWGSYDFWSAYRGAVRAMLDREEAMIQASTGDEAARAEQMAAHQQTAETFETLFDPHRYEELRHEGRRHFSQDAFLAALLISLYRDEPAFHMPFRLLTALIDIDGAFTAWRQRHALMAHRMIGGRVGTGGSSGHRYLAAAAQRHRVFLDLFELPTFLLPRSELPKLPDEVFQQLQFRYGSTPAA